mmetsp:Transcript_34007/g.97276  ORF Transcript_34007/g.97276 Transcript_34007/m.97276 type:complete len:94 (+) Transcript_34007:1089-1370(+)
MFDRPQKRSFARKIPAFRNHIQLRGFEMPSQLPSQLVLLVLNSHEEQNGNYFRVFGDVNQALLHLLPRHCDCQFRCFCPTCSVFASFQQITEQ